jgi:hypothetical protein
MVLGGQVGPQQGKSYLHVFTLKKIFSKTSRSISINICKTHPWVKGILNCSNKGPGSLQRGDKTKIQKWGGVI